MANYREQKPDQTYEQLFVRFSGQVEKWLLRAILILALLLVVMQALLQVPSIRKTVTLTEQLEGEPLVQKNSENP